jgi:hypothetical protein
VPLEAQQLRADGVSLSLAGQSDEFPWMLLLQQNDVMLSGTYPEFQDLVAVLVGDAECGDFYEAMKMFDSDRVHLWRHESGIRIVLTPAVLKEVRSLLKQVVADSRLAPVFEALDARYGRL